MSPARFLLAGLTVALAEAALGVLALPTGLAPFLFACAAATVVVAVATRRMLDAGPRDEPGGDGGTPRTPDDDPPPPWWPQFEAGFAAHVRRRERAHPQPH